MPIIKRKSNVAAMNASPNAHRNLTNTEKALITQAVAANPAMTRPQVNALAKSMNRNPVTIQKAIERARGAFMGSAEEFVALHKQGVRRAIEAGPDSRGFAEGLRSLQWAIERMKDGTARIVETVDGEGGGGTKIFVGVKVGGEVAAE